MIGEKFKKQRKELGYTQEEIAKTLNVSRQTISNWENNKNLPDISSVIILSDLYNLSLDELLKGDVEMIKKIEKDSKIKRNLLYSGVLSVVMFFLLVSLYSNFSYPYIEMLLRPFHLGFIMESNIFILAIILIFSILFGYNAFQLLNKQISKKVLKVQFIVYLLLVLIIYLFKSVGIKGINLNPITLIYDIQNHFIISILNILFFIPLGVYAAFKFKKYSLICVYSLLFLFFLEIIQYIFSLGIADISDIVLHFIGILIGSVTTIMFQKYGYQFIDSGNYYELKILD